MLLDANLLLYAVHKGAEQHEKASAWLTEQLNGPRRVGLPCRASPRSCASQHTLERSNARCRLGPLGSA